MLYLTHLSSWKPYSRDLQKHLFLMLQNCKNMARLTQLHAQLVVNGFFRKNVLATKILSFCIASGNVTYASLVFNQVEKPNTTLCNQIIRATYSGNMPESSLIIYNRMRRRARADLPHPNSYTYAFLLAACAKAGPSFLSQGEQLHCRVISGGFCSSVYVLTNLINMYAASATTCSRECIANAHSIFEEMPQRNIVSWNSMLSGFLRCRDMPSAFRFFNGMPAKDKVSWTIMITGCAQAGRISESLTLFRQMRRARLKLDHVTMTCVLSACADLGDLELGRCIHGHCYRILQTKYMVNTSNSLIHMYVKCGAIDDASQAFTEMPSKSTVTWTTMIAGLAMHGCGEEALNLFKRLLQEGGENEKPDWMTFIAVLCACSYMGRIDEGLCLFEQMISVHRIEPRMQHYCCIVDMLSRAGHLKHAEEMINKMPMQPSYSIWGALLGGCFMHKDEKLASQVINKVIELEPDEIAGHLVSVSNLYAAATKWSNSQMFRKILLDMSITKPTACSLIYASGAIS